MRERGRKGKIEGVGGVVVTRFAKYFCKIVAIVGDIEMKQWIENYKKRIAKIIRSQNCKIAIFTKLNKIESVSWPIGPQVIRSYLPVTVIVKAKKIPPSKKGGIKIILA